MIDRAAALFEATRRAPAAGSSVLVDEMTAGLLRSRFEVVERDGRHELLGEPIEAGRRLAGSATPCVGRERELRLCEGLLAESFEEPLARAVVVTAPPGTGKTRFSQELIGLA
jgi:eukaryotic-like serine/threonine-protein kinase